MNIIFHCLRTLQPRSSLIDLNYHQWLCELLMSGFDQEAEFSLEDGVGVLVRLSAPAVDRGVTKTALFPRQSSRPLSISPEQIDCLQEIKSRVGGV